MASRSYLYVPGDRPERFRTALDSGADAVVFDLEDAVRGVAKDFARGAVVEALDAMGVPGVQMWVRINESDRGEKDLRAIVGSGHLDGVIVPKATPASVGRLGALLPPDCRLRVCALVESALGVVQLSNLASTTLVSQLALGEVDLAADLALLPSRDGREFWPIRLNAVVSSAAYGCRQPIGPVWTDVRDTDGLRTTTDGLRRAGFGGRQAIHPAQVAVINESMAPTVEEVERATYLVDLASRTEGGAYVDAGGRMVDEAVVKSAKRLLGWPS
jgi:citrate lyase subunit beta/citryl-CoA lyase